MSFRHTKALKRGAIPQKPASLNLVSLMDIFTILVFFLMVNTSDVQVLESNTAIALPDSNAEDKPGERLLIQLTTNDLVVQGRQIATLEDILSAKSETIPALLIELGHHDNERGAVTIMGDKTLPYELLKKVMRTCQQASFTHIALAVNQAQQTVNEEVVSL